jgi:hypothetical protein
MKIFSESNKMTLEIVDINKNDDGIFLTLRYLGQDFEIHCEHFEKSIRMGDWVIIDSE